MTSTAVSYYCFLAETRILCKHTYALEYNKIQQNALQCNTTQRNATSPLRVIFFRSTLLLISSLQYAHCKPNHIHIWNEIVAVARKTENGTATPFYLLVEASW